jgi:hypothetical protein
MLSYIKSVHIPDLLSDKKYHSLRYQEHLEFRAKMKIQILSQLLPIIGVSAILSSPAASFDQIPVPVPGSAVSYNYSKIINTHFTNPDNPTERSLVSATCILVDWGFTCS